MATQSKARAKKTKRVKAPAKRLDRLQVDQLLRLASAAESIADNLRALALPNPETWLIQSVRDWYEMTGRKLRTLGFLD